MKSSLLALFVALACFATATTAQNTTTCYLTIEEMPDMRIFLPAPPDTTSEAFAHDVMRYFWGKQMRQDSIRGRIAAEDANWTTQYICQIMSIPFGMQITPEATPEIYQLVSNSINTADLIGKKPKAHYMRKRPFDRFKEPSLVPKDDEALSHNGSYPSGHTIRGWSAALVLAEINPARATEILARGFMYGDSRVIVGAHWQSDVDAGRLAASAAVTMLHTSPAFQEQMTKAKAEFQRLRHK
ncbi:MAG: phosphatase PAP2 family protein [Bacteroidaceae bacterium]|nr:phosphatase PAP2 family protein [Bacteroidaceae bacterium]